ncbi:MAG: GGDEF-domain containing protein, partial [Thiobacillus sp.]|nr:GGDEF-domain containing protein [Thiobacillus sp.]
MKGSRPISIKHIGLAFVTGLLVLVSLIGGFSAYQTRALTHNLAQHNHDAARSELAAAVQRLLSQTEDLAIQLAEWDETRQQLVVPEYYPYWRDQRVYESGILPSRLLRVALYTQAGTLIEP